MNINPEDVFKSCPDCKAVIHHLDVEGHERWHWWLACEISGESYD